MGQMLSKRPTEQTHPHHHHYYPHHHHPPQPPPQHPHPPPLPVSQTYPPTPTDASPPPPPTSTSYTPQQYYNYNYNYSRQPPPPVNYQNPYFVGHGNGWFRPPGMMLPPPPPPMPLLAPAPYVDHQSAKKIKNDVNVHKDTIKLEVDEDNRDCHLVSFTFDALVDGSITIYYFAKEGGNCSFTPLYPELHVPVKIPFQQGLGQEFRQPSGSGIDLGFFDIDDLSKPSAEDVFPLVISAETSSASTSSQEESADAQSTSPHAQITQAVIGLDSESHFQVKVMKQILWVDQVRYELREIFGMSDSDETAINDKDSGKECVICMTEPKDTAVLPCRHMCLCRDCANELRLQSNKCPICRQPIQELLEIKVVEEGK